jgi:excisionase family DNA binding protein
MSQEAVSMTDVVSSFEAARILDCSSDNVRRLAREGRLKAVITTGAGRLFSRQDVEKMAAERRQRHAVEPAPAA